jgi:hypothetical protein
MQNYLNRSQLNVSANILEKAVLLPEDELNRIELSTTDKNYPKVKELLFHNPFAKPKKKKGKKKKKR